MRRHTKEELSVISQYAYVPGLNDPVGSQKITLSVRFSRAVLEFIVAILMAIGVVLFVLVGAISTVSSVCWQRNMKQWYLGTGKYAGVK